MRDGALVGFLTLDFEGYIDLAFVHSQHAGHDIGHLLYAEVEVTASAKGISPLTTQASIKARPFLAPMGW
ncbi:GNAT family N-acetyltransferase [Ascidiaceihabitans sp.]|nr:GNAT family N-acetyltransferase [Ascidiaceihabitans sp.]MDB4198142.1 GNAT family N-acetyltransferase [Ascidiaceihabitans sp.]